MRNGREHSRTILVVEDDPEWRDFCFGVLGSKYPVQYATNGQDALRIAREDPPALILLDIMLPGGMDGFSVFCELKESVGTKEIPVIMLTEVNRVMESEVDVTLVTRYFGSAPAAFLDKPISPERLLEETERTLGARRRHFFSLAR